jgi:hypothetical protein
VSANTGAPATPSKDKPNGTPRKMGSIKKISVNKISGFKKDGSSLNLPGLKKSSQNLD